MNNIVFIGSSSLGLQQLSKSSKFKVIEVLCLKNRIDESLKELVHKLGLTIKLFEWKKEFTEIILNYPKNYVFFIYQLDMIIPKKLTDKYSFFNLHRGSLHTNRGPNPEIRSILNGNTFSTMSLHKINEKIDSGMLIDDYQISILKNDNPNILKKKLEKGIPSLIESLEKYLSKEIVGMEIKNGIYYPRIIEEDFTIDLKSDSLEIIDRKIRSQEAYNGAILIHKGKKYYTKSYNLDGKIKNNISKSLLIKFDDCLIQFIINIDPKYKPLPTYVISKWV